MGAENLVALPGRVRHSGFFVLRTPLLPFDDYLTWTECAPPSSNDAEDNEAWHARAGRLRTVLKEIVNRVDVRQALYLASPSLEASLKGWLENPETKKGIQTERALVRYFTRMASRPTPFGLFAGYSIGIISEKAPWAVRLASRQSYSLSTTLSFKALFEIAMSAQNSPSLEDHLLLFPTSTLRKDGQTCQFLEWRKELGARSLCLVQIEADSNVELVLAQAKAGSTLTEIASSLLRVVGGITLEDARGYVRELVDSGLLASAIVPEPCRNSSLSDLVRAVPPESPIRNILEKVVSTLSRLNSRGLGIAPADYVNALGHLHAFDGLAETNPIRVDMRKPLTGETIPSQLGRDILEALEFLGRSGAHVRTVPRELYSFQSQFVARYGHRWIPLLDAIDSERGVGFGDVESSIDERERTLTPFQATLLPKLLDHAKSGSTEIVLSSSDVSEFVTEYQLPQSFSVTVSIAADSLSDAEKGRYTVSLRAASHPSGVSTLARWCTCDSELQARVSEHISIESALATDCVLAEIALLPELDSGDVLRRPILRQYTLTWPCDDAVFRDQIPASDLLVTVTPSGKVILYSPRLDKRVEPRLTAAHNFHDTRLPALYRFLCHLQTDPDAGVPMFSWGVLSDQPFLPRVRVGNVVVSGARWRISAPRLDAIRTAPGRYEMYLAVQSARRDLGLPRWIQLSDADATLVTDLDNPLSVDAFAHAAIRSEIAIVRELYPGPDSLFVTGPEGRFHHEMVIPFLNEQPQLSVSFLRPARTADQDPKRDNFPPGDEWLYVRLYGGHSDLDHLLGTVLSRLVTEAYSNHRIGACFFIRYEDPFCHLRIRFKNPDPTYHEYLRARLNELFSDERLWRIEYGTYERETLRYGGDLGITLAEDIFCADTTAVLSLLARFCIDGTDARYRLPATLLSIDRLMADFRLSLSQRAQLVAAMAKNLTRELGHPETTRTELNAEYRRSRKSIEDAFGRAHSSSSPFGFAKDILESRSKRSAESVDSFISAEQSGFLTTALNNIVMSLVHMNFNRMQREYSRMSELRAYTFLEKFYHSQLARGIDSAEVSNRYQS
jgi:lantibiotic biosynthesis protein